MTSKRATDFLDEVFPSDDKNENSSEEIFSSSRMYGKPPFSEKPKSASSRIADSESEYQPSSDEEDSEKKTCEVSTTQPNAASDLTAER